MPLNAAGIFYADTVTPMSIQTITSNMAESISNVMVTTNKQSYIPTLAGIILGNGSIIATSSHVGNIVIDEIIITFGSTTAAVGDLTISGLPVTAHSDIQGMPIGTAILEDAGNLYYMGQTRAINPTAIGVRSITVSGIHATASEPISATTPFTWGAGDRLFISSQRIAA